MVDFEKIFNVGRSETMKSRVGNSLNEKRRETHLAKRDRPAEFTPRPPCPSSLDPGLSIHSFAVLESNGKHMGSRLKVVFPRLIRSIFTTQAMASREEIVVPPPVPTKLQELIYAFRESKALFAACDLGDLLHESDAPQSAKEISSKMSASVDATTRLMDTLVALELLEKTKQGESWLYSNTEMAKEFLTKSSPNSVDGYIKHSNKLLYHLFGNLESTVREGSSQWMNTFGQSSEDIWKAVYNTEEARLRYLGAMHSTSRRSCHAVVTAFDLSKFQSCCDLGGGTGAMAYTLCQYYPNMKITVCELQSVMDSAHHFRPSSEDCPNQGNVSYVVGDFFQPDLPKADLYTLCHVLPDWSEDKVGLILSNAFKCLSPGGGLLIAEKLLNEDKTGPRGTLLQSLNMLVQTQGKERTVTEYKQLLEEQGFVDIQVKQPGLVVMLGIKP